MPAPEPDPAPAPPVPLAAGSRYAVLGIRDLRLYLIARFVASFAQQMLGTAVGWELFERTHSALALGFVGLTQIVPLLLLTLPAGHVADQRSRRNIILVSQAFTAVACAGLTFVSWSQAPVIWTYVFLS